MMPEPMIDIDLTYDYLEEHYADECKCEADHEHVGIACSVLVTHRYMSCGREKLVCQSGADYVVACISEGGLCEYCLTSTSDCWSVISV
jgi:hypothetical protein